MSPSSTSGQAAAANAMAAAGPMVASNETAFLVRVIGHDEPRDDGLRRAVGAPDGQREPAERGQGKPSGIALRRWNHLVADQADDAAWKDDGQHLKAPLGVGDVALRGIEGDEPPGATRSPRGSSRNAERQVQRYGVANAVLCPRFQPRPTQQPVPASEESNWLAAEEMKGCRVIDKTPPASAGMVMGRPANLTPLAGRFAALGGRTGP